MQRFEAFIAQHRDEITALQILYNRPTKAPLKFSGPVKALDDTLQAPPHLWTESQLWQAYAALDQSKVKGESRRMLTDLVSLVRYAMHQENELEPYPEKVMANFRAWLAQQNASTAVGSASAEHPRFTEEQRCWLEKRPSTSPAISASRPRTSATRRSTSAAG